MRFEIFFGYLDGWFFRGLGGGFLSRFFAWYSFADGPASWIVAAYAAGYKVEHFKVKIIIGFVWWFVLALFCGGLAGLYLGCCCVFGLDCCRLQD